ncbi:right-handed parallel beta-helix repeat-containing protein [Luteibacter aegosomaticola]|uniref:right-handed parallel beta-helix repeat-containing protein n=1 Tax=Luteibacter aegosomaticola TaxID=2911538 RepID=UPI001FF9D967|nr:right-handed parallel beta-helix repeat-containing protein [Luteibacter aegosomaticola]UPG88088.1 right-handed parallel beta-helix repeat-containing protein [Luteibacter aegosomaticola]
MIRRDFLRYSALAVATAAALPLTRVSAAATGGRTWYIDATAGSDSHAGTSEAQAFRSLDRLNKVTFGPGDRILFKRGGDYPGAFLPKGSGSAGAPVTVDAYGQGALPHLHADGQSPSTLRLQNIEYWTVRNLEISNQGPQPAAKRTGVHLFHQDYGVAHGITLQGLHVRDVNGLPVKQAGGGSGILVEAKGKNKPTRYDGLLIADNVLENTQRDGILFLAAGDRTGGLAKGVAVRGNRLTGVPGDGILVRGCDGAVMEHNTISKCGPLPRGEAAAGIWPFDCDNTTVQYNEVSDHKAYADGQGFDSDFRCRNTLIQYNYSHDNVGGMALVCNDGRSGGDIGNTGTIVRYNVSINDALRKTDSASLRISGPVNGSQIYNNIIIIPDKPLAGAEVTVFKATKWKGVPSDIAIHDNIVVSPQSPGIDMQLATATRLGENRMFATAGGAAKAQGAQPASAQDHAMLDRFRTTRPTLAQVNTLVKACFADGKPVPNAMQLIGQLAAG